MPQKHPYHDLESENKPLVCFVVRNICPDLLHLLDTTAEGCPGLRFATAIPITYRPKTKDFDIPTWTKEALGCQLPNIERILYYESTKIQKLFTQLDMLMESLSPNLPSSIVLHLVHPKVSALSAFKKKYPDIKLILRIGPETYQNVGATPRRVLLRINDYRYLVDTILLKPRDRSLENPIDLTELEIIIDLLSEKANRFHLAIANGFDQNSGEALRQFLESYPGIGIFAYHQLIGSPDSDPNAKTMLAFMKMIKTAYPERVRRLQPSFGA